MNRGHPFFSGNTLNNNPLNQKDRESVAPAGDCADPYQWPYIRGPSGSLKIIKTNHFVLYTTRTLAGLATAG